MTVEVSSFPNPLPWEKGSYRLLLYRPVSITDKEVLLISDILDIFQGGSGIVSKWDGDNGEG